MAIAFEDADTGVDGTSGGVTVTPAGGAPANGEVVYIAVSWIANSSAQFPSSYTLSGFTEVGNRDNGVFGELTLFRKVAGGSEPTTYTVTWTGGNFYNVSASCLVLSGVDTTTPEGTAVTQQNDTPSTTINIPALTTTENNSWDLVVVGWDGEASISVAGQQFSSWGDSLIERTDRGEDYAGTGMSTALRASAGAQGATTVTSTTSQKSIVIRIEVFEAGGAAPTIPPLASRHLINLMGV